MKKIININNTRDHELDGSRYRRTKSGDVATTCPDCGEEFTMHHEAFSYLTGLVGEHIYSTATSCLSCSAKGRSVSDTPDTLKDHIMQIMRRNHNEDFLLRLLTKASCLEQALYDAKRRSSTNEHET